MSTNNKTWVISDGAREYFIGADESTSCGYNWLDDEDDEDDIVRFASEKEAKTWLDARRRELVRELDAEDDGFIIVNLAKSVGATITGQLRKITLDGVQLGIGLRVAEIIQEHTIKALLEAKVPSTVLEHPVVRAGILVAAPVTLSLVLPLVPKVKVPEVARSFIEAAATAAVAKVTDDISKVALRYLKPMIKDIVGVTKLIRAKK